MALMTTLLSLFLLQERRDRINPEYADWSKFKIGSSVTMKAEVTMGTWNSESVTKAELTSIDSSKAIVETRVVNGPKGASSLKPAKKEILARTPLEKDVKRTESQEEIEAAGRKLACTVVETVKVDRGSTYTTRTWYHESVPGGVVRMLTKIEGPVPSATKITLVEFSAK